MIDYFSYSEVKYLIELKNDISVDALTSVNLFKNAIRCHNSYGIHIDVENLANKINNDNYIYILGVLAELKEQDTFKYLRYASDKYRNNIFTTTEAITLSSAIISIKGALTTPDQLIHYIEVNADKYTDSNISYIKLIDNIKLCPEIVDIVINMLAEKPAAYYHLFDLTLQINHKIVSKLINNN